MSIRKRLIVVGDGGCGKTCLLYAFSKNEFFGDHVPTIYETYSVELQVDQTSVMTKILEHLIDMPLFVDMVALRTLKDTAGQEEYERLRPICYQDNDVVLICYSIEEPNSLENVKLTWINEVNMFCPKVPVILVANKNDLRDEQGAGMLLSSEKGREMSQRINARAFFECSAKTREGVRAIFEAAVREALMVPLRKPKKKRHERCKIN